LILPCLSLACGDPDSGEGRDRDASIGPDAQVLDDSGTAGDGSVDDGGGPDASPPPTFGGMPVTTTPELQELDLFGKVGHVFWIEVSAEQLRRMNEGKGGPGIPEHLQKDGLRPIPVPYAAKTSSAGQVELDDNIGLPVDQGDIYTPGELEEEPTFADHLVIKDSASGSVADYGRVEVRLVGESTVRPWSRTQIPNVRIDANEFQPGLEIGGFEHLRLNNSLVGSIFRALPSKSTW